MRNRPLIVILLLMLAVALAGCAEDTAPGAEDASDPDDGAGDPGDDEAPGGDGDETGDPPEDSGDTDANPGDPTSDTWGAFAFDAPVRAGDRTLGTLVGYTYAFTQSHAYASGDVEVNEWTATVTYEGVHTEGIRAIKETMDPDTYEMEEEQVTTNLDVHRLIHHVEVQRAEQEYETSAGGQADAVLLLPAAGLDTVAPEASVLQFTLEADGLHGTWAYGVTQQMREDAHHERASYRAHVEGDDPSDWWAFSDLTFLYDLNVFHAFAEGEDRFTAEDAERRGMTLATTSFQVSGHTFPAYRLTYATDGINQSIVVAPDLPVVYEYRYENTYNEDDFLLYRLTTLDLA